MLDYKTFKKGYLTEWVDRSQAARKAAEELANKEVKTSLRNKQFHHNVKMELKHSILEFKGDNEVNGAGTDRDFFTWEEASRLFKKPDADGWRLPRVRELQSLAALRFDLVNETIYFPEIELVLPALGGRNQSGSFMDGGYGAYLWTSTPYVALAFGEMHLHTINEYSVDFGCTVRLVRDVK